MSLTLKLHDFTFSGIFECPQMLNGGGKQKLAVHDLIGGKRIVDAMGNMNDDIAWHGSFLGITAFDEASYLGYLRNQGNDLIFTYGFFKYLVKIKEFKFTTKPNFLVDYHIVLTVVEDQTQPVTIKVPSAFDETVLNDLIEAGELATLVRDPSVTSTLALLDAAVNAMTTPGNTNPAQLAAAIAAANSAVNTAAQALAAFEAAFGLREENDLAALALNKNPVQIATEVMLLEKKWQQYQALKSYLDNVTRVQRNIVIFTQTKGTEVIQQVNGNLYQLAVKYYNDPLQWTTIAESNKKVLRNSDGFVDPFITGMVELIIPPAPTESSKGYMNF